MWDGSATLLMSIHNMSIHNLGIHNMSIHNLGIHYLGIFFSHVFSIGSSEAWKAVAGSWVIRERA